MSRAVRDERNKLDEELQRYLQDIVGNTRYSVRASLVRLAVTYGKTPKENLDVNNKDLVSIRALWKRQGYNDLWDNANRDFDVFTTINDSYQVGVYRRRYRPGRVLVEVLRILEAHGDQGGLHRPR